MIMSGKLCMSRIMLLRWMRRMCIIWGSYELDEMIMNVFVYFLIYVVYSDWD